jgi:hypothetical protein
MRHQTTTRLKIGKRRRRANEHLQQQVRQQQQRPRQHHTGKQHQLIAARGPLSSRLPSTTTKTIPTSHVLS